MTLGGTPCEIVRATYRVGPRKFARLKALAGYYTGERGEHLMLPEHIARLHDLLAAEHAPPTEPESVRGLGVSRRSAARRRLAG